MLKKKFKVRVKHYSEEQYVVQYAHYYFIPVYNSLCSFYAQGLVTGAAGWMPYTTGYETAERLAKRLKSIEDVREWHKDPEKRARDFYKRRKEYYSKNVPYRTKYF